MPDRIGANETPEEFRERTNARRRRNRKRAKELKAGMSLEEFELKNPREYHPRNGLTKEQRQAKQREATRKNNFEYRRPIREFIESFKVSCQKCGESDICALDFHHRDPVTKKFSIAQAHRRCLSIEEIAEEIVKCDVLCANCHRKLHRDLELVKSADAVSSL